MSGSEPSPYETVRSETTEKATDLQIDFSVVSGLMLTPDILTTAWASCSGKACGGVRRKISKSTAHATNQPVILPVSIEMLT